AGVLWGLGLLVGQTVVPRRPSRVMSPLAVALMARPLAVPVWEMVPPAPLVAWKVRLPEPLVRMPPNVKLPAAPAPAVSETSPPPVLRLQTVRSVPAGKLKRPPAVGQAL